MNGWRSSKIAMEEAVRGPPVGGRPGGGSNGWLRTGQKGGRARAVGYQGVGSRLIVRSRASEGLESCLWSQMVDQVRLAQKLPLEIGWLAGQRPLAGLGMR